MIVGSSLTARLTEADLGPRFYNLAFPGGSMFTGLELVARRPNSTRVVLIESNIFLLGSDGNVLANAFRPVFCELRPYLPALRERFQPANLLAGRITARSLAVAERKMQGIVRSSIPETANDSLYTQLLSDQKLSYSIEPSEKELQFRMSELQAKVKYLEALGIRCAFVEMPIDSSLTNLPLASKIRGALLKSFPSSRYIWIQPQPTKSYATTDGIHLTAQEAVKYAVQVKERFSQITN